MKKIDLSAVAAGTGSTYPSPFDVSCKGQTYQRLRDTPALRCSASISP